MAGRKLVCAPPDHGGWGLTGCVCAVCRCAVEEDGQNYYAATVSPGYVWALGWRSDGGRYVSFVLADDEGLALLGAALGLWPLAAR
jgi:hypothetical protein